MNSKSGNKLGLWKWVPGRQGDEYEKFLLGGINLLPIFGLDCYLLRFAPNCFLRPHKDPVDGKHYRLNVELKGRGEFNVDKTIFKFGRITLFRPDLYTHSMQNGDSERLVLSIGINYGR